MRSSARSERIGPTPASTAQRCVSPSSPARLHPRGEARDVEDVLRLDELGARGDLLTEAFGAERERRRERVLDAADEPVRRRA